MIKTSDNLAMNDDRFYKVRPLFEHLNKVSKHLNQGEYFSVDEIMVPYYGKHGDKQFIRGKPIRFGFKLWAACSSDGSLLHVEPYCGSHSRILDAGLRHGLNVIMDMCGKLSLGEGQHMIFDNFFGTVTLLKELAKKNVAATCTLREDRLCKAPGAETSDSTSPSHHRSSPKPRLDLCR